MKKTLLSIAFIAGFAAWTIHMHQASVSPDVLSAGATTLPIATVPVAVKNNTVSTPIAASNPPKKSTTATPGPTSKPAPKQSGKYTNGTYVGSVADAYYGNLQVQAVIVNGALADVQFVQYPSDRSTSRRISAYALPRLKQEAIQSQSANVSTISGATDVSGAFRESLRTALSQAARA